MTGRLPGPTPRALCAGFEGDRRRRVARDRGSRVGLSRGGSPPPCGARGTHAGAPARRRGTRGGRARGARGRACGRGRRGTRGCIRVGSRRRTTPGETTPGTPCSEVEGGVGRSSGGTTRRRSPGGRQGAERGAGWVTIPPGAEHRPAGGVDHESAVKWLTTGPPLKPFSLAQRFLRDARALLVGRSPGRSRAPPSRVNYQPESRMRAIRQSGSEGGPAGVTTGRPYPYQHPMCKVPLGSRRREHPPTALEELAG